MKTPQCLKADYELADATAIQAVAAGTADKGMQQRAMKWIIENGCATYDVSFQMGDTHGTAFAEGRRFAGLQIVKLLKLNVSILRKKET